MGCGWIALSVKTFELEGYECVGRRDHRTGQQGGGIAAYVRREIAPQITSLSTSDRSERQWFIIHAQQGPILLCNWYRPPSDEVSIGTFEEEWRSHKELALGTLCVGDLNVHSQQWLRFSNRESAEGKQLREVCSICRFEQVVREPTREAHLLDLVLTDLHGIVADVLPEVADHRLVLAKMRLRVPEVGQQTGTSWRVKLAPSSGSS